MVVLQIRAEFKVNWSKQKIPSLYSKNSWLFIGTTYRKTYVFSDVTVAMVVQMKKIDIKKSPECRYNFSIEEKCFSSIFCSGMS